MCMCVSCRVTSHHVASRPVSLFAALFSFAVVFHLHQVWVSNLPSNSTPEVDPLAPNCRARNSPASRRKMTLPLEDINRCIGCYSLLFLGLTQSLCKKNVQETALLEAHLSLSVKPLLHEDLMNHWFGWPPAESAWPRISGMGPTIMQTIQWTLQFVLYIHKLTASKCSLCSFQMLQFLVSQTWLNVSLL